MFNLSFLLTVNAHVCVYVCVWGGMFVCRRACLAVNKQNADAASLITPCPIMISMLDAHQ